MTTDEEFRQKWERWFERAGAPGFRVVGWSKKDSFFEILLVKEDETGKQTITYTMEV